MNPVRVGVLGTGGIVRAGHLPALATNPRARVVALGNLRGASLETLARGYKVERTYTDFERMARDPDIDAVVNALPNYLHAPVSVRMLQAGKHVLCEKPMATTAAEARGMVAAAEAAGRTLMVAHVWRSHPAVRWLRDVVASGRIGTVFKARAHAVVVGRGPRPDSWFVRREESGGGALIDVGVHSIDTLAFVFGDRLKVAKVAARFGNYFRDCAVEDTADVRLEFDGGLVADVSAGWYHDHAGAPHGAVELFGTEGYARTLPAQLQCRVEGVRGTFTPAFTAEHPDEDLSVFAAQIDHFLDCVSGQCTPVCDGRHGLWDMTVVDAAYAAR
jgi:predicted dehydrogenase